MSHTRLKKEQMHYYIYTFVLELGTKRYKYTRKNGIRFLISEQNFSNRNKTYWVDTFVLN